MLCIVHFRFEETQVLKVVGIYTFDAIHRIFNFVSNKKNCRPFISLSFFIENFFFVIKKGGDFSLKNVKNSGKILEF